MKHILIRSLAAAIALWGASSALAQITIGNIRAAQRPGTKLVDIDYDLTGIATPCTVWLEISADGGTTWAVPATTVSGAVGNSVTPGANLRLTWDAGVDWNGQTSAQTRFRVKADDRVSPDPADFATIPGGNFQMGDALDGMTNAPLHTVNVSAFYMQKKGVTKAQWDTVRTWGQANGYDLGAGAGKAADHPVQTVSWYDAVKWCNARSEMEGLTPCYYTDAAQTAIYKSGTTNIDNTMVKWSANGYRLPTEAEREKAARGGLSGKRFPWGNKISHSAIPGDPEVGLANYYAQPGSYSYDVSPTSGYHPSFAAGSQPYTSPAGSFAPNGYGVFDMAGNVWEWCWDWFDSGYYGFSPSTDPPGPASGPDRVVRGGYWSSLSDDCRVAVRNSRDSGSPGNTNYAIGFRPVRR